MPAFMDASCFAWAGPKGDRECRDEKMEIHIPNAEVEIPAGTMEEFKIKVDGKKMKIQSADVESLLLWHAANPDKKYLMKYADRRENRLRTITWTSWRN